MNTGGKMQAVILVPDVEMAWLKTVVNNYFETNCILKDFTVSKYNYTPAVFVNKDLVKVIFEHIKRNRDTVRN